MEDIKASSAFDGVHLVPVGRYGSVATRLEKSRWSTHSSNFGSAPYGARQVIAPPIR